MPKFFISQDQINGDEITIIGQDVNHIINVLRMNEGDRVNICNINSKNNYIVEIFEKDKDAIKCKVKERLESESESNIHIDLFQGLPKADKMELIIQKNIEIGVNEITPVEMNRCVVKLDEKSKTKKIDRWQKIAETAAKQSGRDYIPEVNNIINIKNICNLIPNYDIVLLAYEEEKENLLKDELKKLTVKNGEQINVGIIIGPEGGMEAKEVEILKEAGATSISLGKRILRTETARTCCEHYYNV